MVEDKKEGEYTFRAINLPDGWYDVSSGCCFKDSYNITKNRETVIPIDMYVPGCPPKPEAMIEAVAKLVGVLNG